MKDQLELTIRRMSEELRLSETAADRIADQLCGAEIEQRTAISRLEEVTKTVEDLKIKLKAAQNKITVVERNRAEQEEQVYIYIHAGDFFYLISAQ